MKIQKIIEIQLVKKRLPQPIDVVQYDTGVQLVFAVQDFTIPNGTTATLYVQKPSGKFVYQETGIVVSENSITIDLENQALTEYGENVPYQVQLKNGADLITTFAGIFRIEKSLKDAGATKSKSVISAFSALTAEKIAEIEAATIEFTEEASQKVADKGVEVMASIPEDYTATYNLADAAYREKADAIIGEASGEAVIISDGSDDLLRGLKLFGKTEQITTTGAQLVDFSEGTTATGVTATFEKDVLTVVGDGSLPYQSWSKDITALITEHPGEVISFNYDDLILAKEHDGSIAQLNIANKDGTNTYYQMVSVSGYKKTYSVPNDTSGIKSVHLAVYSTNNGTAKANTITIKKPILHYGITVKEYEPYSGRVASPSPEYPQDLNSVGSNDEVSVNVTGANLFDVSNATIREGNGLTGVINADGSITVNGTPSGKYAQVCSGTIKLPIGKYFVSGGENAAGCAYFQLYANKIGGGQKYAINGIFEVDGTEDGDVHYSIQSGNVLDPVENYTLYPMFNIGESQMNFEPYKHGGVMTLQLSGGLPGIPVKSDGNYTDADGQQWVCDELDFERGVKIQRIGVDILNGSEDWQRSSSNGYFWTNFKKAKVVNMLSNLAYCDQYIYTPVANAQMISGGFKVGATSTSVSSFIYIKDDDYSTVAAFKARLESNPVTVQYILEEPVETPISAEQLEMFRAVHANKPNTTILNDSLVYMAVKYNMDIKAYTENKLAELTAADVPKIENVVYTDFDWNDGWWNNAGNVDLYDNRYHSQLLSICENTDYYIGYLNNSLPIDVSCTGAYFDEAGKWIAPQRTSEVVEYSYKFPDGTGQHNDKYVKLYKFTSPPGAKFFSYNISRSASFTYRNFVSSVPIFAHENTGNFIIYEGDPAYQGKKNKKLCVIGASGVMIDRIYREVPDGSDIYQYIVGFQEYLVPWYALVESYGFSSGAWRKNEGSTNMSIYTGIVENNVDLSGYDEFLLIPSTSGLSSVNSIGEIDSTNIETYMGGLNAVINHIYSQVPLAKIYLANMLHKGGYFTDSDKKALMNTVNERLAELAAEKSYQLIDLAGGTGINDRTYEALTYDGTHLNHEGSKVQGLFIRKEIVGF